jgi:D-beta-D-heptose 7-phosphate kinase/D-beta-D-heptose 1-phosphate adenosyltransferase
MSLRIDAKVASYEAIASQIRETGCSIYRNGYERIVFTNGCFDMLHPGHVHTLKYAKDLAGPFGALVVGINDDDSVRRLKGSDRPVIDCDSRALMLMSLRFVDHVVSFEEDTPYELIKTLRPDVIVKGADHAPSTVVGGEFALVVSAPIDGRFSTTKLIEKIRGAK